MDQVLGTNQKLQSLYNRLNVINLIRAKKTYLKDRAFQRNKVKNINNFQHYQFKSMLEEEFKLPVIVDNDSRAMALGEHWFGAGRGVKNLVLINVSDGIGSGMIIK